MGGGFVGVVCYKRAATLGLRNGERIRRKKGFNHEIREIREWGKGEFNPIERVDHIERAGEENLTWMGGM